MKKGKNPNVWLAMSMFLLMMVSTALAQTIYVDADATGNNDGSNWADAHKFLQDGLAAASSGDEVWVAQGTYKPDQGTGITAGDRYDTFQLKNGVTIKGGYAGYGEPDPNARDIDLYKTILSGDLVGDDDGHANRGENSYHVVTANGTNATAVLSGFTITAGYADGPWQDSHHRGGGMLNFHGSPVVTNCRFIGNSVTNAGGGIYNHNESNLTLTNCAFIKNSAVGGAGMYNSSNSNPSLVSCMFAGNSAEHSGGGMSNYNDCDPTLANCIFSGNYGRYGGGLRTDWDCRPTVINCTFNGNSAEKGGGILNYNNGSVILVNSILWGNTDSGGTGELAQLYGGMPIVNYSCIQGLTGNRGGTGNIDQAPMFVNAEGVDGIVGTEDDNLQMSIYSPCIDAGDNSALSPTVITDANGDPRFIDIPWVQDFGVGSAPIIDMGAYETKVQQSFIITDDPVSVAEGNVGTFTVALALEPLGEVTATVTFLMGDTDISIELGAVLQFDFSNYSNPQTVTLAAAEDADFMNGRSLIGISTPLVPSYAVTAIEADNEPVPAVVYVDQSATGAETGLNWADALTDLQDALNAAADRLGVSQILVADGTYKPDQGVDNTHGDRTATFQLINGVAIRGGYAGFDASDPNERDIQLYETFLSGDLEGNDVDVNDPCDLLDQLTRGENSYHVVTSSGNDANAVLDGFTITAGNANSYAENNGGGMLNDASSPTLRNCTFTRNYAINIGGGMLNYNGGNPMLTDCLFSVNSAAMGGGVDNSSGNPTLTNCTFRGNLATLGGAMVNWTTCNPTLTNCTFIGNSARDQGGGIYNASYTLTLTHCTFSRNLAILAGGMINFGDPNLVNCMFIGNLAEEDGGGMLNLGNPILNNCVFSDNSAGFGGGLFNHWEGTSSPILNKCTFRRNLAEYHGGGMSSYGSGPTLTHCTFSGNLAAGNGGGMYNSWGSNLTLTSCTFCGNYAEEGGSMYNEASTSILTNCIFGGSVAEMQGEQIALYSADYPSTLTVSYSDVEGGLADIHVDLNCSVIWGFGNIEADPCFVEPGYWADANDPNIVVEPNDPNAIWIDGDYHLKSKGWRWDSERQRWDYDDVTSRCIDAGNPGAPLADEPLTILPDDPNNDWGKNLRVNMGAYGGTAEASMPPYDWVLLADLTNDGTVNFEDFAAQAIDWLESEAEQPGDLTRDGIVDIVDLALLMEDWLEETIRYEP